jgi:hypothetical protein
MVKILLNESTPSEQVITKLSYLPAGNPGNTAPDATGPD